MDVYEHPNYDNSKKFLIKNGFNNKFSVRESSLDLSIVNFKKYSLLLEKLDQKGIKFYDGRDELSKKPDYYKKLEELRWIFSQDFPMPEGIVMERGPYDQFLKYQKLFEKKRYGVEIIATYGDKYVGSTDIHIYPNSDPHKAWTGGLGVLREYRRQGIATALKVKAFIKLRAKGVSLVRTDNEENNPMYLINVALGFKPEPYCYEYQKNI
jgi:GNAT superfamily N-acetyltransferase